MKAHAGGSVYRFFITWHNPLLGRSEMKKLSVHVYRLIAVYFAYIHIIYSTLPIEACNHPLQTLADNRRFEGGTEQ
ncbi:hypothetical protein BU16DRAFT_366821 [Lophium mytilinum]|uniref:Uncharacterized protein n=1 Tax=Lophium mytilinum TaxID=390894 RepID=A0A6A6QVB5_9PEZI|nr:hypothetical protein BU16DRAFT_366821 [Lophium mytilinum]